MPRRATKRGDERTPLEGEYDVLVCGASFAGLTVARELAGSGARVLVLDRYEIGERQTSACAAPTEWLEAMGVGDSIRQTFDTLVVHTPHDDGRYRLPWTFSTFDYRELCGLLWEQCDAEFETAKVDGRAEAERRRSRRIDRPRRPHGAARRRRAGLAARARRQRLPAARRAALARARGPSRRRPATTLEIWIDRGYVPAGYGWSFPAGDEVRIGVGSFDPRFHVKEPTVQLADDLDTRGGPLPGQLDPAQAAPGDRGRRLLRRRLGRPLPAADRRGHPHRLLLRDRLRARAARAWSRGGPPRRPRCAATATSRRARVAVPVDAAGAEARPEGPAADARARRCGDGARRVRRLVVRPLPADRASVVREGAGAASRQRPRHPSRRLNHPLANDQKGPGEQQRDANRAAGRDRLLGQAEHARAGRSRPTSSAGR